MAEKPKTHVLKTSAPPRAGRKLSPAQQKKRDAERAEVRKSLAEQSAVAKAARDNPSTPRVVRREFSADGSPKSNPRLPRDTATKASTPPDAK